MKKSLKDAITIAMLLIGSYEFMIMSRVRPSDFSRAGEQKLGFATLIKFALNFIRKSCQLELDLFFDIKGSDKTVTKQAYSEARQKIRPEAFITLNDAVTSWFYGDDNLRLFMATGLAPSTDRFWKCLIRRKCAISLVMSKISKHK